MDKESTMIFRSSLLWFLVHHIEQEHLDHECPIKEKQIRPQHSHKTLPSTLKKVATRTLRHRTGDSNQGNTSIFQSPLTSTPQHIFPQTLLHHSQQPPSTEMHQQDSPAIVAKVTVPAKPRCSERQRTATARFVEGWCALHLPTLSLALGVGAVQGRRNEHATTAATTTTPTTTTEGEMPPDDDVAYAVALGVEEACDEAPALGFLDEEDQAGAMEEPRRSDRERWATRRFAEGWFGEGVRWLAVALGGAVREGRARFKWGMRGCGRFRGFSGVLLDRVLELFERGAVRSDGVCW